MRYLSKSQFTRGLQCMKSLWFYRERKDLLPPPTPEQRAIFDQGTAVGILAQQRFPGGVLIQADHRRPEDALAETATAIAAGATTLYEAAFLFDDVLVRADVVVKEGAGWVLYEVKSSTEIKEVFLHDVAVQRYVMDGAGFPVVRAYVALINTDYVRQGAVDPQGLFRLEDVTSRAGTSYVHDHLNTMKLAAGGAAAPEQKIGGHCDKPYPCDFKAHCWAAAGVPPYSVFNLAGARMDKKLPLWEAGVRTIAEIPPGTKLTANQAAQVVAAKTGHVAVNAPAIANLLKGLAYPLSFLDFEAVNPAVPPYDGLRPYQNLAFQASVHILERPGTALQHHEFLADGMRDPRPELVDFLLRTLVQTPTGRGSIVAYNKSYEGGILKGLASDAGGSGPHLLALEARLWDLADPFRKALYVSSAFKGSWSIKKVLPALVPGMTYEGLAVADGLAAQQAYTRLMFAVLTPDERAKIRTDLRAYCGTDTLAMVRLLEHLWAVTAVAT